MGRIDDLMSRMTLEEKLGQLTMVSAGLAVTGPVLAAGDSSESVRRGQIGNFLNLFGPQAVHAMQKIAVEESRLGIPLLIGFDVIHGHRTTFPVPLAEAGALDPDLWERTARESAAEAAADGISMVFAPMLDVSRDPRWGRIVESPGEDPWIASRMAEAKVRGCQGVDLSRPDAVAAVAKHYCAYGAVTAGREYASVDVSERTLHEVHLPAFEAAVRAGVAAVMPAFTDLDGIPMTANRDLLEGWLRGNLGFDGVIVSDYNAIAELIRHGVAADIVEASALALNAGVDIDMMADAYRRGLPVALDRGLVAMSDVDRSVRRVLSLKERLGLFDDPFARGGGPGESQERLASRRVVAREAAQRSLVLLTNDRGVLPLSAEFGHVAVVGPLADSKPDMRGPWAAVGEPDSCVTVLEALRAARQGSEIVHVEGVDIAGDNGSGIAAAVDACRAAHAVVLCVGEAAIMSGEAASRSDLGLPGRQVDLCEAVLALGKPTVAVLFSGRPLIVPWLIERADATLASWFPGAEAGNAIVDILIGRQSPSGRTMVSWPRNLGQVPIFYGERPTGRWPDPKDHYTSKYLDVSNSPLFPFGHGLTYGRFALSDLAVEPALAREGDTVTIAVDVANHGPIEAEETLFAFTHDKVASVTRPVLELKAMARVRLGPGATGKVRMEFPAASLKFLGRDLKPVFEPGEIDVFVGPRANRAELLSATIRIG
jgi:beta-glucosidase